MRVRSASRRPAERVQYALPFGQRDEPVWLGELIPKLVFGQKTRGGEIEILAV